MRKFIGLPVLLILFISCTKENLLPDYPNSHLLMNATELNHLLQRGDIFLIDARQQPGDTLIPGAVHFAAIQELIDPGHPIDSYLIGPEDFQEKMQTLGLNNDHEIVIYDEGNNLSAARLFYALDYYGFSNASLLNGGIEAWLDADLPISRQPAASNSGNFTAATQERLICDFEYILEASNSSDIVIFDVRSAAEYSGEDARAAQGGHIPNAANLEWNLVLEPEGIPYFLPADQIEKKYADFGITPDKEVIPYCQTNVRGSHAYFTLRLMGYDSVRPYEGSWVEYGNHDRAIVQ